MSATGILVNLELAAPDIGPWSDNFCRNGTAYAGFGAGANTAIFSVVKAVLLNPLPYGEASRLVAISERSPVTPDAPNADYPTAVALRRCPEPRPLGATIRFGRGFERGGDRVLPPEFEPLLEATSEIPPQMYCPLQMRSRPVSQYCESVRRVGRPRPDVESGEAAAEANALLKQSLAKTMEHTTTAPGSTCRRYGR